MLESFDKIFFEPLVDSQNFESFLKNFGFIKLVKVPRGKFEKLKGEIIQSKNGINYLFLPFDLKNGEFIYVIEALRKKFPLNISTTYDNIITQIKVMIQIVLRDKSMSEEDKKGLFSSIMLKYNIPFDFLGRFGLNEMKFSVAKESIKKIKARRDNQKSNQKLGNNSIDDVENGTDILFESIRNEFYLTFLGFE